MKVEAVELSNNELALQIIHLISDLPAFLNIPTFPPFSPVLLFVSLKVSGRKGRYTYFVIWVAL